MVVLKCNIHTYIYKRNKNAQNEPSKKMAQLTYYTTVKIATGQGLLANS